MTTEVIYLLRGIMGIPYYFFVLMEKYEINTYQSFLFDAVSFTLGLFDVWGTILQWKQLKAEKK